MCRDPSKGSPIGEALVRVKIQSLPSQGRWLGAAETERSQQICDDLSVSLRLTAPLKGEPCPLRRTNPSGPSGQLP